MDLTRWKETMILRTFYYPLEDKMRKPRHESPVIHILQWCQGTQIRRRTRLICRQAMVQSSSQIHHEATFFQKLAVLILQIYQKLEGQASSPTALGWPQPNTTNKRSKPGVYSVADRRAIIPDQTSIRSIIPELIILALRTNHLKGLWLIMVQSIKGS